MSPAHGGNTVTELRDEVVAYVATRLKISKATLTESTYFVSDLGIDSMRALDLVADVETRFDVEIPDARIRDLATLGDLIAFITKQRG